MAFTKVTGPGIHTLANITSHNINSSGIITATKFVGPLEASSGSTGTFDSLTVTGNVSVGGTLTYEDVTNIDSVGIITARKGISVSGGGTLDQVNVTGVSTFTGIIDGNGGANIVGGSTLDQVNVTGVSTFAGTIDANGALDVDGQTDLDVLNVAEAATFSDDIFVNVRGKKFKTSDWSILNTTSGNALSITGGGSDTEKIRINSSGFVAIGTDTPSGNLHVQTTSGTYDPLVIERKGSANWGIKPYANILYFRSNSDGSHGFNSRDRFAIGWDGTDARGGDIQFYGTLAGVTSCIWDASDNALEFKDNSKTVFGDGSDLSIYHDSANSQIHNTTGTLRIRGDSVKINNAGASKNAIVCESDVVTLYHDNSARLATNAKGISVTGEVAATQDYPDIRPRIDFNFLAVKKLDPRFTYQRTGPGSYVDEFGLVRLSAYNEPRFDHDPMTGECKGLLIEQSSTNQMINSNDITGDTAQNGTITGNATTAPDGTLTADRYAANTTNGIHRVDMPFTSGQISNSTAYTFSVFVKANGYDKLHIRYGGYNADDHGLGYDLSDGTTFAGKYDGTSALGGVTSSSMIEYPNDWYRCIFTVTTAANAASGVAQMFYYISNSEATTNFAGDGSSGMYFWGAQMETCDYATSLVVTDGSTRSRGGELLMIEGKEFSDFYNQNEGTLVLSASYTEDIRGSAMVVIDDTSNESEYTEVGYRAGGAGSGAVASYIRTDAGNDQYYKQYASSSTQGNEFKVALAYKDNDYASSVNGQTVDTDTSGTTSKVYDRLRFSDVDTVGVVGSGHYRRFMYYPKRLSNNQVVTLTS